MSYNNNNNNYLITTTILIITTVYHLLNIIPIAFSIDDTELHHICLPSNKNFANSYNQSRALVAIDVIINTASRQGFRNASYTWFRNSSSTLDDPNEWSYGLALCRGDVSADECKTCVNNASLTLIDTHCPDSRSAVIWRDYCLFKYSDVDFFGIIDTGNMFSLTGGPTWISRNSSNEVKNLMDSLQKTAIAMPPVLYASDNVEFSDIPFEPRSTTTVYGLVQCTRDLSKDNCKACLGSAIRNLNTFKQGARVVYGSCNVRYETYPF